jgi:hypothetical protein
MEILIMPVLAKSQHEKLRVELQRRISELMDAFEGRKLKSNNEGIKGGGHWIDPDSRCATVGDSLRLNLAVEDFKTILAEIKRLK